MAKQQQLEGVGPKTIKEIEDAAEAYVTVRNSRMALTKQEVEAKKKLADAMHKHEVTSYPYESENDEGETIERTAEIKAKETVKVKTSSGADDDDEESEASDD